MGKIAGTIERVTNPVSRIADGLARVVLALMVLLITLDVVLRYFFNRPIKGSYELVEFMMAVLVYLGLAYTQTAKGHVCINLLTAKLSPANNAVIGSVTNALSLGIFALITWRCILQAEVTRTKGAISDI